MARSVRISANHPHRRSRRRSSPIHSRNHGERGRIYRRARLGRRCHGYYCACGGFRAARQSSPRAWLAVWLVEAFVAVAIAAPAAATKAHRANSALFSGPGRKFLLQFCSADYRRGIVDICSLSRRSCSGASGRLAASIRNRYRHRRSIFRARRSGHGLLPHGSGRHRALCSASLGRRFYGRGVRRFADWFRNVDCAASRGIEGNRMAKSSTARQERLQRTRERTPRWLPCVDPRRPFLRTWTG